MDGPFASTSEIAAYLVQLPPIADGLAHMVAEIVDVQGNATSQGRQDLLDMDLRQALYELPKRRAPTVAHLRVIMTD